MYIYIHIYIYIYIHCNFLHIQYEKPGLEFITFQVGVLSLRLTKCIFIFFQYMTASNRLSAREILIAMLLWLNQYHTFS